MKKEDLEKLINEDKSIRDISKETEKSFSSIRYWLRKYEIKTNNKIYNKKNYVDVKFCLKCKKEKPLNDFYKKYKEDNKHASYCKKCSNIYHTIRVKEVKIKMINLKGGKCERCNLKLENSHYCVFEFHHKNPSEKDANFNKIKYKKWDFIKKELNKCELLCANCHRLTHAEIENW